MRVSARLLGPGLLLALALGCATTPPRGAERFRVDVKVHGAAQRFLSLEVTPESGWPEGGILELKDVTSVDDSLAGKRRLSLRGPERDPQDLGPGRRPAGFTRLELKENPARKLLYILEFKGSADVYHVSFPPDAGVEIEPDEGDFSRVSVRSTR